MFANDDDLTLYHTITYQTTHQLAICTDS